ncbi:MAG: response regulator [Sandaracinaceae bacterium]|nr:response regulator [Sandaracinaceae bacterium]
MRAPRDQVRVLVIDDDVVAQKVIAGILARSGFEVHTLDSPIGATRTIREQRIDIVACDLDMPAMRGDAFARMFRKSTVLSGLRLVLISAASKEELARLASEGTVDAVVHKGDLERELVPVLRRLTDSTHR